MLYISFMNPIYAMPHLDTAQRLCYAPGMSHQPSTFGVVTSGLSEEQIKIMKLASLDAEQLLSRADSLPDSRYKSLFTTTLENAMMWFNKAVSRPSTSDHVDRTLPSFGEESSDG